MDTVLIGNTFPEETPLMLPMDYDAVTDVYKRKSVESHFLFATHIPKRRCLILLF